MARFTTIHRKTGFSGTLTPVLLLFLVSLASPFAHAEKWQDLNPQGYVNDFAGVLNDTTSAKINQICTELQGKAKAQIAVVTIKTLGDEPKEDFGNQLFQKWGVGFKGTDRGVMVLLATEDHKYWTEVGYGLEPILPDGRVGTFGRAMVPLLRQGDDNGALLQMVVQIAQVIAQDSHVDLESLSGIPPPTNGRDHDNQSGGVSVPTIVIIIILVILFFRFGGPFLPLFFGGGGGWGGGGFGGGGGGGGGFGGFGGGSSGGGGAGGSW